MGKYKKFYNSLCNNSYVCSICNKRIYPKIISIDLENNHFEMESTTNQLRGGLGSMVIIRNICDDCAHGLI